MGRVQLIRPKPAGTLHTTASVWKGPKGYFCMRNSIATLQVAQQSISTHICITLPYSLQTFSAVVSGTKLLKNHFRLFNKVYRFFIVHY